MASFETISLEKGMYTIPHKNFSQVLEELDPSEAYKGTSLEGLDAYQRQLKRFDIRVGGAGSDTVEKFFQSTASAALFPEYVSRAVKQGMEQANVLPSIVATVTNIDTRDYRSIASDLSEMEDYDAVAESGSMPEITVSTKDTLVNLKKRGRMLVSSYEALRFQKLDLLTVTLRQIGAYIARAQLMDAIEILLKGDDGTSDAETVEAAGAKPTYSDMVNLWGALAPYSMNTALASTATMKDLLGITQFQDAQAGLTFQGTGKIITPLGANLIHVPDLDDDMIIALDKNCALEMVQAGDILLETDKLIDRQLERASVSAVAGFSRIFDDACKVLTYGSTDDE